MNIAVNKLRKNIMRRVYYAYALRVLVNRGTIHLTLMAAMLMVFFQFVSLGAVLNNFSEVTVGHVGQFALTAIKNTEIWTLLSIVVLLVVFISFTRGVLVHTSRRFQTI